MLQAESKLNSNCFSHNLENPQDSQQQINFGRPRSKSIDTDEVGRLSSKLADSSIEQSRSELPPTPSEDQLDAAWNLLISFPDCAGELSKRNVTRKLLPNLGIVTVRMLRDSYVSECERPELWSLFCFPERCVFAFSLLQKSKEAQHILKEHYVSRSKHIEELDENVLILVASTLNGGNRVDFCDTLGLMVPRTESATLSPTELSLKITRKYFKATDYEFTMSLDKLKPVEPIETGCKNLVYMTNTVDNAVKRVLQDLDIVLDSSFRKCPALVSRCPRGGKTTMLKHLHVALQKHANVISVSFNGSSQFTRKSNETDSQALYRVIIAQLVKNYDENALYEEDWDKLNMYIKEQGKCVLLIDEINKLCPYVQKELYEVLKKRFLDVQGRMLVMTTHQTFTTANGKDLTALWATDVSGRPPIYLTLPTCFDKTLLIAMDPRQCQNLTNRRIAYFGGIPSLMYSECMQETTVAAKFSSLFPSPSTDENELLSFVLSVFDGSPRPECAQYLCFSTTEDVNHMRWPTSYIGCILGRYHTVHSVARIVPDQIAQLNIDTKRDGDGKSWETTVEIAILLQFFLASKGVGIHDVFKLCSIDEAKECAIDRIPLSSETLEEVRANLEQCATMYGKKTLVVFSFVSATVPQFDFICAFINSGKVLRSCGIQCKDSNEGSTGTSPEWLNCGGYLLKSNPTRTTYSHENRRWKYYNKNELDSLLGYSLQILPARL